MRLALAIAALSVVALAVGAGLSPIPPSSVDAFVRAEARADGPNVDLSAFWSTERDALLDPSFALPHGHRLPYAAHRALARYAVACDTPPEVPDSMTKALEWTRL